LVAVASEHLTREVAMRLPFESLGMFKTSLKRLFSREPWTPADALELSNLVTPYLTEGWWEHELGDGLTMRHGVRDGSYVIDVCGRSAVAASTFDRMFTGPVVPQQTPHPRKVMFHVGGDPAPGVWHRRGEDTNDPRVAALMDDDEITDVMVAGDFVTIGLARSASWEDRLDGILDRVTALFFTGRDSKAPARTRDELLEEAGHLHNAARTEYLHLMDPDSPDHREALIAALDSTDARRRRAAVVTLALSGDSSVGRAAVVTGYADYSLIVRRAAIDAAADLENEAFRPLFDSALFDPDPWIRWRAVRAIGELGVDPSIENLVLAAVDEDFRVRFEAAAALQEPSP
jgi:hypothetical protein